MAWASVEGLPYPLGVSLSPDHAYNFALYSKHATSVRLLMFDDDLARPRVEIELTPLTNKSGRIWHCRVPEATAQQ